MKRKFKKRQNHKALGKILGKISVNHAGFAFIRTERECEDFFVPEKFVGNAIDRDIVEAEVFPDRNPFKTIAKVVKIVERGRKTLCGELISEKHMRPLSGKIQRDIKIKGNLGQATRGDWVEVAVQENKSPDEGVLRRIIGKAGFIQNDLEAVASEYNISPPYTKDIEEEFLLLNAAKTDRLDMTEEIVVTIDPADAKDHDDAISISKDTHGNYKLGVHIADVSAWIHPGSILDSEAFKRSFSAYLPGKTLPMLPSKFTKKISLAPGKKSLCHSVIMKICGKTGKILESKRQKTTVNVSAQLTFDDVEFFIRDSILPREMDGLDNHGMARLHKTMAAAVELYRKMHANRKETEEFLEVKSEYTRVICEEGGNKISGLKKEVQRDAEKLVEEFMLAANVEVAKEISKKHIPGIYRIHPPPFPEKVSRFSEFVKSLTGTAPGDISSRASSNNFLRKLPDDHKKTIIMDAFIGAMAKAYYSEKRSPHFGLGKTYYTHFTSPIRRYPDLLIHQQLTASDSNSPVRSLASIARTAEIISEKEILNDEAFRAANDRLKLHFLADKFKTGEIQYLEAIILKEKKTGILVLITEYGITGEIPFESFDFSGRHKKHHGDYKTGDFISLKLINVDLIKGKAKFLPYI
jgi:VacB/RNase II family 3'-5' exoribonuclease